jgi:glycosyltransferase involved in cell wall biosynthesis
MGFYPQRLPATIVVHDYRSLSIGFLRRYKDWIKRILNAEPDLRVFQNHAIRTELGFPDDENTIYLRMGVPQAFIDQRRVRVEEPSADFVYIGTMIPDRRCDLMLDSFVHRFGARKSFHLYGPPNPQLQDRYRAYPNIQFRGSIPQKDIAAVLRSGRVGVCYFPLHRPHLLQPPVKLIEYAAVGMRILANDHPQSRDVARQYGISCMWGQAEDLFGQIDERLDWDDNMRLDASSMSWNSVIPASGIDQVLDRIVEDRRQRHEIAIPRRWGF